MENNNSQDSQMNPLQNDQTTTTPVTDETASFVRVEEEAAEATRQQPATEAPTEAPAAPSDPHGFQPIGLNLQKEATPAAPEQAPAAAEDTSGYTRVHPVPPEQPAQPSAPQQPAGMPQSDYVRVGDAYDPNKVAVGPSDYSRIADPTPVPPQTAQPTAAAAPTASDYTRRASCTTSTTG